MRIIIKIIICLFCVKPALSADLIPLLMGIPGLRIITPEVQPIAYSEQDLLEQVGALPTGLDNVAGLQVYAAHYAWASGQLLGKNNAEKTFKLNTYEDPCLRIDTYQLGKKAVLGIESIFLLARKLGLESIPIKKQDFDVYFYFFANIKEKEDVSFYKKYFAPFLMEKYEHLLPNYAALLKNLKTNLEDYAKGARSFLDQAKKLSDQELAKLFGIERFAVGEREQFFLKMEYIYNDINRFLVSVKYLAGNPHAIQVLDVYLLAEQSFHIASFLDPGAVDIIHSGHFFPDGDYAKNNPGRKNIEQFFHHRQMPLRSLFLMTRAVAFSLRDFADKFRAQVKLPPISAEIFKQDDRVTKAFVIDESLPTIEDLKHQAWLEDSLVAGHQKKNKKQLSKNKKQKPKKNKKRLIATIPTAASATLPTTSTMVMREAEESDEDRQEIREANPLTKPCIGTRVLNLLNASERSFLQKLFSLQAHILSHENIQQLTMAVFRALVDLNKAHRAAEFLKRSSDARIFTKGKDEQLLSKESLEYRLLPYMLQNIVHPDFDKDVLLKKSDFLRERVLAEKIMLYGDWVDTNQLQSMERILFASEDIIKDAALYKKRVLLINLAHAWHKLTLATERAKAIGHKEGVLKRYREKIVSLLKEALIFVDEQHDVPVTVLEAYLLNYYLKVERSPAYKRLTSEQIKLIQQRAAHNMNDPGKKYQKTIHKVSPSGKKLGEYTVDNSIYHAITNDELGDYIMVTFEKPVKDGKIPLFVYYNDQIYRTDVFGGSRLKPNPAENDYGSLFGVSLKAADFFKAWFTSTSSFWYGQRAFMPAKPNQITKASKGRLLVQTIPDDFQFAVLHNLIMQDGLGYIKASVAEHLGLKRVERAFDERQKFVAYQALHGYAHEGRKQAAKELFEGAKKAHLRSDFAKLSSKEKAQTLMCSIPKKTAIGIPVKGDAVVLPDDPSWRAWAEQGVLIGRNPYSAKRIQVVEKDHIQFSKNLSSLQVFQYTLTGYQIGNEVPVGSFFKGLLVVIPDEKWPKKYKDADILASSKDQKLNQLWLSEDLKNKDQKSAQLMEFSGMLMVKEEYHKNQLVGLSAKMAEQLAGDFDGDPYDIMPQKGYRAVSSMIKEESQKALANPKLKKPFIIRKEVGNFEKILDLRKPLNADWNNINNRFNYLSTEQRQELILGMAKTHILEESLGKSWASQLGLDVITSEDIVISEIQLGLKIGEDAYKAEIDVKSVIERDQEYQRELSKFNADSSIPYGNGLIKKLEAKERVKDAVKDALKPLKSANIVDKAFRGMARYVSQDKTYVDYVSDDEEIIEESQY